MIDHYTLLVQDYEAAKAFYAVALEPLGYSLVVELTREQIPSLPCDRTCGFGANGKPSLWLRPSDVPPTPTHIAFAARSNDAVDAFHAAAVGAGAKDNGAPGPRPYHANYYGAFVLDADGYNVEAVHHGSE